MQLKNHARHLASVVAYGWENDEGFHFSIHVKDLERGAKRTFGSFLAPTKNAAECMIEQHLADQGYITDPSSISWS